MGLVASGKLAPNELVETLLGLESAQLDDQPFGAIVLLVRAPADDDSGQFLNQLVSSVLKEASSIGDPPRWPTTSQFPTLRMAGTEPTQADHIELLSELSSAPHCIVPLRHSNPEQGYLVGRAAHAKIVLSDPSVSAEHARLVLEEDGIRLSDLSSKNGTTLNGRGLIEGETPWLQPMDRITFGRVQAFACDPRVLRAVLRQDIRTLV